MNNKNIGVYLITSKITGHFYIGSTYSKNGFQGRWNSHESDLRKQKHHAKKLQELYNLYGSENLQYTVLEEFTKSTNPDIIISSESNYIKMFFNDEKCVNGCDRAIGGNSWHKMSDDRKQEIIKKCIRFGDNNTATKEPITLINIKTKEIKTQLRTHWRKIDKVFINSLLNKTIHVSKNWMIYDTSKKLEEHVFKHRNKQHTLIHIETKIVETMSSIDWINKYDVYPCHLIKGKYFFSHGWTLFKGYDFDYNLLLQPQKIITLINIKTLEIKSQTYTEWYNECGISTSMLKNHNKSYNGWRMYDPTKSLEFYKISPRIRDRNPITLINIETKEIKTLLNREWYHMHKIRMSSLLKSDMKHSQKWTTPEKFEKFFKS